MTPVATKVEEPLIAQETPSGTVVAFYADPRRYTLLGKGMEEAITVPSVTELLKVLDKPDLPWWGMGIGVDGMLALWEKNLLARTTDGQLAVVHPTENVWTLADHDLLVEQLKLQRLTTNHVVKGAGDRGQSAHDALEAWAVTGELPEPGRYPPPEQEYVRATRKLCEALHGRWETRGAEVIVGSLEHGYAGRYDLRGRITEDVTVVRQALRKDGSAPLKGGGKRMIIPAGTRLLGDLKTSKRVYSEHLLQLVAYEYASVECGYEETDLRAVLHVTAFGEYEFVPVSTSFANFLAVKEAWGAMQIVKAEVP